ncbi:MFS transporter [Flaviflagellibacter deserti]|uniref:MFS transporter n=1 Tax=Flaviflagellibacter deserti TaxID=2267266 RepID=A0ABV9Z121_9HYPH
MLPPRVLVPLIVACALFMENLDSTVLATALPAIARDIGADPIRLKLALTSYLLSLAVFIPASGWMADRFGARSVFRLAIAVFMLGSIFCGLSSTMGEIIAARIVQGMGGAMMVPVGRLVILRTVPKSELVGSLAWLTIPALIGPVVGPPLGGFITTYFHWRWIFWINLPIGVLGLILATMFIPNVRGEEQTRFDTIGFILSGIGMASFVTGSTAIGLNILPIPLVVLLLLCGATLLTTYVFYARRVPNPILDLSLFRIPTFRISITGGSLFRIGIGAIPFLLPLLFQLGFGMTPFQSGMLTFAASLGAMAMKFAAPPILRTLGFRTVMVTNAIIASLFVAAPIFFTTATPGAIVLAVLLAGGFFRSLQFTSVNALGYSDVSQLQMSRATSMTSVAQQVSLSVGVSIAALTLETSLKLRGDHTLIISDFTPAFIVVAVVSALSVFAFARLKPNAGAEVSGHRRKTVSEEGDELIADDPIIEARERG